MTIFLRGHHILCLQGFQGYGYSEEFVENMTHIKNLIDNENIKIKVSNTPDDICQSCPNLTEKNICKDLKYNEKIKKMDNEVIKKLDIGNEEMEASKLFEKANFIFNSKETIEPICDNCLWVKECIWFQKYI
ncbi:DUF1284 domain-containing protein [Methanobrevibacter sp. OttesenSCG-928-K11]|nr:DUF1284 domain-containing protein [Methanobrevibacter sp. OttesenSCG-928-K11]MDL2270664.1 DUF1284 domain-containing protein [Methanobrevibacter sp. OttesenSCG-928-I08]